MQMQSFSVAKGVLFNPERTPFSFRLVFFPQPAGKNGVLQSHAVGRYVDEVLVLYGLLCID